MKPFIPREWIRMRGNLPWLKDPVDFYAKSEDDRDLFSSPVIACQDGRWFLYEEEYPEEGGIEVKSPYSPGEVCWVRETYRAWFPCDADGQPIDDHWHVRYKDGTEQITGAGWNEGPDYLAPDDVGLDKEPGKWRSPVTMPQWAARRHVRILSCVPEQRDEWGWRMEWEESDE